MAYKHTKPAGHALSVTLQEIHETRHVKNVTTKPVAADSGEPKYCHVENVTYITGYNPCHEKQIMALSFSTAIWGSDVHPAHASTTAR
jgi:hypothetical protein